jgi:2-oxoglutarate dehydrogenase E2 component (dihydrolipoamide succinyltransferase)
MAVAVTMPQMGESVVEGTVARWLKAPGEAVSKLEALVEISTDKIDTEIPAPAAGTLLQVVVDAGQTVRAGTVLGYIGSANEQLSVEQSAVDTVPQSVIDTESQEPPTAQRVASTVVPPTVSGARKQPDTRPTGREFISPVVARMAAEHQLDLNTIAGSGLHGRITKRDVLAHLAEREPVPTVVNGAARAQVGAAASDAPEDEIWQPLTTMRRVIAQHMVQSKQTSPHVTTVFEVDMTQVVRHREQHKEMYAQRGVRLTYTPYFVAAVAMALRHVPEVNARFDRSGEQSALVLHKRVHVGVAVALEQGLIVPVIRDADERNLQGLARAIHDLAQQARSGQLAPDAVRGGTFTITNHGVSGSLLGTPIINQPQAGILGIGAIVKRPVVRSASESLLPSADDAIVIRPMCFLSFSFDHRILDGARADAFMSAVVEHLQHWPLDTE